MTLDDQHVVTIEIGTDANVARLSFATTESVVSGNPTWIDADLSGDCCGSLDEGFEAVRWVGEDTVAVAYSDGSIELLTLEG